MDNIHYLAVLIVNLYSIEIDCKDNPDSTIEYELKRDIRNMSTIEQISLWVKQCNSDFKNYRPDIPDIEK